MVMRRKEFFRQDREGELAIARVLLDRVEGLLVEAEGGSDYGCGCEDETVDGED